MVQYMLYPNHLTDFLTYVRPIVRRKENIDQKFESFDQYEQLIDLLFLKRRYHNKVNEVMYVLRVHSILNN
jgi:hypothetical protein